MAVMEKLKMFVVQEPVVAASCLIAGVGLFLPAVVRPILDSLESSKQVRQPALSDPYYKLLLPDNMMYCASFPYGINVEKYRLVLIGFLGVVICMNCTNYINPCNILPSLEVASQNIMKMLHGVVAGVTGKKQG
ncbi:hypothetical protein COLO4_06226 [Corchorus olitorius]|uniref:Uncharacterized protein n=1 Tax=Corchorus olitorius TaxID=93759 RepID=A0A1R3KNS8_9ROSI|nr:hypothetical protein COLO4_06226 [Corchorus olitorius]